MIQHLCREITERLLINTNAKRTFLFTVNIRALKRCLFFLGTETEAKNCHFKKQKSNTSVFMVVKEKLTYIKIFMLFLLL